MVLSRLLTASLAGMIVFAVASTGAAREGEDHWNQGRIMVERESGRSGGHHGEYLESAGTLTLLKGECVILRVDERNGRSHQLSLEIKQADLRIRIQKKGSDRYELCGQQVSFTEPETRVHFSLGESNGREHSNSRTQGEFTVVVELPRFDIDRKTAGECAVTLYWGILFRFPGDPNQSGNEAYNYARTIEQDNIPGLIRSAEEIAGSDEFRQNIAGKFAADEIVANFYWRFLGIKHPTRDATFNRMVDQVKHGRASQAVADLVTTGEFLDRVRRNEFNRGK